MSISNQAQALLDRGTTLLNPESIEIGPSINPKQVSPEATIHQGCRIRGENTIIGPGCVVGEEGPATIVNCQLEKNVSLKGGYFSEATFLYGSSMGTESHVRAETILEEHSSCAHTSGLKHTILMPFVTIGSLVNFCDCFMAGGTGKKNHSEVGSSYIHFNFTPNQDKATPSLIGDVPRGVMLDQQPIFLGGQGGLVGPACIEYGTVIAAGSICRRDINEPGKLVFGSPPDRHGEIDFRLGNYGDIKRILKNNFNYIGNIFALKQWYSSVRTRLASGEYGSACINSAIHRIDSMIKERFMRLDQLSDKMLISMEQIKSASGESPSFCLDQANFNKKWPKMKDELMALKDAAPDSEHKNTLLAAIEDAKADLYTETIQNMDEAGRNAGTAWLTEITESAIYILTKNK